MGILEKLGLFLTKTVDVLGRFGVAIGICFILCLPILGTALVCQLMSPLYKRTDLTRRAVTGLVCGAISIQLITSLLMIISV